jgi:hypothetical protein
MALASFKALFLLAGAEHYLWLLLFRLAERKSYARRDGRGNHFLLFAHRRYLFAEGSGLVVRYSPMQFFVSANFREREYAASTDPTMRFAEL